MINLLPPDIKVQMRYAKLNAQVMRDLWLVTAAVAIAATAFAGTFWYLNFRINQTSKELEQQQVVVDNFKNLVKDVNALNARLTSIKAIQASQTHYSALLSDLGAVTPKGVFINTITLTGDDKKPVQITATASSYNQATALRDALAKSPRIAGADIESINDNNGAFNVSITMAFKPGQAK